MSCILTLLVIGIGTLSSCGSAENQKQDSPLPAELHVLVTKSFPGWRIKELSDLTPEDRELWLKARPHESPGLVVGNFRSEKFISYALVLIPRDAEVRGYKLVHADKRHPSGSYELEVLEEVNHPTPSTIVVSKVSPGQYFDAERTRSVTTKLDGILSEVLEVGAVLYYWEDDRFQELVVSE